MVSDIDKPIWFRLLNEWRQRRRRGLTLPFLIGAVLREQGKSVGSRSDILQLLDEIDSQEDDQKVIMLGWCADLKMPILHMEFAEHTLNSDLFEPTDKFFVVEKSLGKYLNIPDHDKSKLLEVVVDDAEQLVEEGRFSIKRVEGKYKFVHFDEDDMQFLDSC
ncbi:MAG: hypothetical protein AB2697_08620 [Candidatus Thiodiazotropha endolucinida]